MPASRRVHTSLSVQGLLRRSNTDLRPYRRSIRFEGRPASTLGELRHRLEDLLHAGVAYLPVGAPCDGWTDADGCPGHDSTVEEG